MSRNNHSHHGVCEGTVGQLHSLWQMVDQFVTSCHPSEQISLTVAAASASIPKEVDHLLASMKPSDPCWGTLYPVSVLGGFLPVGRNSC